MDSEDLVVKLGSRGGGATRRHGKDYPAEGQLTWGPVRFMQAFKARLQQPMVGGVGQIILGFVQASIANNFVREEDADGVGWFGLTPETKRKRRYGGYGEDGPMLIRERTLFDEATTNLRVNVDADGGRLEIFPQMTDWLSIYKWSSHNRPADEFIYSHRTHEKVRVVDADRGEYETETVEWDIPVPGREFFYLRAGHARIVANAMLQAVSGSATRMARGKRATVEAAYETDILRQMNEYLISQANMQSSAAGWTWRGGTAGGIS